MDPVKLDSERRPQKAERRLAKKHNRIKHSLQSKGVEISDKPTKILCLYNAGLDNGVTREQVFSLVQFYGDIMKIIMIPQKPYSFVIFSGTDQAEQAQEALAGVKISSDESGAASNATLHTLFVNDAPCEMTQNEVRPPGLILKEDFVTAEYEAELLAAIDWRDENPGAQKNLKHRKVKHYGYEFLYGINNVDPSRPLSQDIPQLCDRLLQTALTKGLVKHYPDQLTVNQYSPGQGIPPHVDTPSAFEDGLMSLSLGSQVVMDFHHPDGRQVSILLPRRSLLVMTGESRYVWSHGITARKSDIIKSPGMGLTLATRGTRTSLTFRKIIFNQDPHSVDHLSTGNSSAMEEKGNGPAVSEEEATILETKHVHKVYEEIASHFSETRHSAWPRIADFIRSLPPGSLLADIGCGNGKYLGLTKEIFEVCSDRSSNLAAICAERGHQTFVCDLLSIPLRTRVFDVCLCIAVIHHLSTPLRRENALRELVRILAPGGQLLVYVWAMEQERGKVKSKYINKSHRKGADGQGHTATSLNQSGEIQDSTVCPSSTEAVNRLPTLSESTEAREKLQLICNTDGAVNTHSTDVKTTNKSTACDLQMATVPSSSSTVMTNKILTSSCNSVDAKPSTNPKECKTLTDNVESISKNLSVHVNRTEFKEQDLLVPWQLKNKSDSRKTDVASTGCENVELVPVEQSCNTFHRYYHVFKQGELELLCQKIPNIIIKNSYYDQGNWCVLLEKITD